MLLASNGATSSNKVSRSACCNIIGTNELELFAYSFLLPLPVRTELSVQLLDPKRFGERLCPECNTDFSLIQSQDMKKIAGALK